MKLVLEGTFEQLQHAKELLANAEGDLPKVKDGYYQTENLWCVEDVTENYDCTDEEALELLELALTNDATMEQIWFALHFHAEDEGFERKED